MIGLAFKIFVLLLAATVAATAGICPCGMGQCGSGQPAVKQQETSACQKCKKTQQQSRKQNSQQCPNCKMAPTADKPAQGEHAAAVNVFSPIMMSAAMPLPTPAVVRSTPGASAPLPPLLTDLYHNSCLLLL